MKRVAVLYNEYSPLIDAIKTALPDIQTDCFISLPDNISDYDLVVCLDFLEKLQLNVIKVHYSLLPSFESQTPVKDAILAGVKLTGITVYYTKPFRILAQYPVFISNDMHYDDLLRELKYKEIALLPRVIQKILNNTSFESQDLLRNDRQGGCCDCSGCGKIN